LLVRVTVSRCCRELTCKGKSPNSNVAETKRNPNHTNGTTHHHENPSQNFSNTAVIVVKDNATTTNKCTGNDARYANICHDQQRWWSTQQ
jgi:hypothetical protein